MPRTISNDLKSHLAGSPLTVARLFLVSRQDGVELALTDADSAITYDSIAYLPVDGVGTTTQHETLGTGVDNAEVVGFLTDSRITEEDLMAGRYDDARVQVLLVNRKNLAMGHAVMFRGFIGEVEVSDGNFRAELRSLSQKLRQQIGDVTTPTCRCARLGNAQCKFNMAGNTVGGTPAKRTGVGVDAAPTTLQIHWADTAATGYYTGGIVKITTGPNAGIERVIKSHTNASGTAQATLRMPFPFAVTAADEIDVETGCDRTKATCNTKFANLNNFHGEPDLPGNDKVQRVGRASG